MTCDTKINNFTTTTLPGGGTSYDKAYVLFPVDSPGGGTG